MSEAKLKRKGSKDLSTRGRACDTLKGDGNSGFIDLPLESSRKLLLLSSGGLHRNEMSDNVLKDLLAPDSGTAAVLKIAVALDEAPLPSHG